MLGSSAYNFIFLRSDACLSADREPHMIDNESFSQVFVILINHVGFISSFQLIIISIYL